MVAFETEVLNIFLSPLYHPTIPTWLRRKMLLPFTVIDPRRDRECGLD